LNSEEFRETFLRNDREGPTKEPRRQEDGGKQRLGKKLEKRKLTAACCRSKRGHPGRTRAVGWKGRKRSSQRSQGTVPFTVALGPRGQ
jgi:hypothetical protein